MLTSQNSRRVIAEPVPAPRSAAQPPDAVRPPTPKAPARPEPQPQPQERVGTA